MCCNLFICGLVNRSSQRTTSRNPSKESGLVMPKDAGSLHFSRRSPALARSPQEGFALVTSKTVRTPQSGLANGPTWAALKKHRLRNTPELRRTAFLSGTEQDLRITVETGACRLNDILKGLWDLNPGEGRNRKDSTLVGTMAFNLSTD